MPYSKTPREATDRDFYVDVSNGMVPGKGTAIIVGHNPAIPTGETRTVWDVTEEQTITYLTVDTTVYLSSSSASDTETLFITGLNDAYAEVSQTKVLTGQTPVALDTQLFRAFSVLNAGSNDLLGDVYLNAESNHTAGVPNDTTKILSKIPIGKGSTSNGFHTVAADKILNVLVFRAIIGKGDAARVLPFTRTEGGVFLQASPFPLYQSSLLSETVNRFAVPEKTDLEFQAVAVDAETEVTVSVDYVLTDNSGAEQAFVASKFRGWGM